MVGQVTLLETVVRAVPEACPVVLVGPPSLWASLPGLADERVVRTREDPPGGGPCAGLAAGMALVGEEVEWVQLLTCDLPRAAEVVQALAGREVPAGVDALVAVDSQGWPQYLCGLFRAPALRAALAGEVRDRSVRGVLGDLRRAELRLPDELLADVDDPDAAAAAGLELPVSGPRSDPDRPPSAPAFRR